jgi:hypothetical protein
MSSRTAVRVLKNLLLDTRRPVIIIYVVTWSMKQQIFFLNCEHGKKEISAYTIENSLDFEVFGKFPP